MAYQTDRGGLPTTYLTCAETAALLRQALKEQFPAVKFSVQSSTYSMGASIQVTWTEGPAVKDVEPIAQAFAGATFDGMDDSMHYHTSIHNGQRVAYGANFVFCTRQSAAEAEAARRYAAERKRLAAARNLRKRQRLTALTMG